MAKPYRVYINGRLIAADKAKISVFDASYLYGEGLFETLVAVSGHIPFFGDHWRRLTYGARALSIPLPVTQSQLSAAIDRTLQANKLKDAYIRINLSAEEADVGRRTRRSIDAHLVIFTKPVDPYPRRLYRNGSRLIVIRNLINDPVSLATIKTTNYLAKMLARREIRARKADEGILLNARGQITECAGSNLFIVKAGRLRTPPIADGVLPGVTRQWVLRLAKRHKIPCREKTLYLRSLENADEIFITSTLKQVMPVAFVDSRRVGRQVPGPITAQLSDLYRDCLATNSSK